MIQGIQGYKKVREIQRIQHIHGPYILSPFLFLPLFPLRVEECQTLNLLNSLNANFSNSNGQTEN
jgi:hypothetical protein